MTMSNQPNHPEALLVARELDEQRITNWTNSTGMPPRASGTRPHGLSIRAAALLRSQHARIERLEKVLRAVIKNRDKNCDRPEQFVSDRMGGYWSPVATMVGSEAISAAREALEQK